MILKSLKTVERQKVAMAGAQCVEMQLLCGPGDGCANFAMRRFIVEPGGCTPKHSHDYEHEVLVLAGEGVAFGNGQEQEIKAGDVVIVPSNEVHQFRATGTGLEILCMVPAFVHQPGAPVSVAVDCAVDAGVGKISERAIADNVVGEKRGTLAEITAYLHEELPLTKMMGVEVTGWDGKALTLRAPLEPNLNHTNTAFGGSISSLGILAGYTILYLALKERGISSRLLIQKSTTEFLRPIDTEITATAVLPGDEALGEFVETLEKKRKARLELETQVLSRRTVAAMQQGVYVAIVY